MDVRVITLRYQECVQGLSEQALVLELMEGAGIAGRDCGEASAVLEKMEAVGEIDAFQRV